MLVLKELAEKISNEQIERIGSKHEAYNKVLKKLIIDSINKAFAEFSENMIISKDDSGMKPGVTEEFIRRMMEFIKS